MKRAVQTVVVVIGLMVLAGCNEYGLSARERGVFNTTDVIYAISKGGYSRKDGAKTVKTPFVLAVAQVGEHAVDKSVQEVLKKKSPWIQDVFSVPLGGNVQQTSDTISRIQDACDLAADLGADYLLVFGGNMDVLSQPTWMIGLDLTVVGTVFIPSYRVQAMGRVAGAFIDVASKRVLFIVSADGVQKARAPSLLVDAREYDVVISLRQKLIERLVDEVLKTVEEAAVESHNQATTKQPKQGRIVS